MSYSNSEESGAVVGCGESGLACAATPPQNHLLRKLQNGVSGVSGVEPLRIVCDSREQAPFTFIGYPATVETGTLASGDYSLAGFESRVAVERKSLQDLVSCLGAERARFTRELERLRGFDAACVVAESPCLALRQGRYTGRLNPAAAWQSILALSMRHRMPFFWGTDRQDAEGIAYHFLRHFHRDRVREFAALCPGEAGGHE